MSSAPAGESGSPPVQPNVVVILADDMGWGDLSCYGASKIQTPAMDRVAAEGLRATDCLSNRPTHLHTLRALDLRTSLNQAHLVRATPPPSPMLSSCSRSRQYHAASSADRR